LLLTGCRYTTRGDTYNGNQVWTKSGILCQRWDVQSPHNHTYTNESMFPDSRLQDAANYCRNPDNDPEEPWCYTTNPLYEKDYCSIPLGSGMSTEIT
jgi:hypothetical protein